jgi:hypothetical protein
MNKLRILTLFLKILNSNRGRKQLMMKAKTKALINSGDVVCSCVKDF